MNVYTAFLWTIFSEAELLLSIDTRNTETKVEFVHSHTVCLSRIRFYELDNGIQWHTQAFSVERKVSAWPWFHFCGHVEKGRDDTSIAIFFPMAKIENTKEIKLFGPLKTCFM
jgi:hypothetical protein